jgi:hypothetical protein
MFLISITEAIAVLAIISIVFHSVRSCIMLSRIQPHSSIRLTSMWILTYPITRCVSPRTTDSRSLIRLSRLYRVTSPCLSLQSEPDTTLGCPISFITFGQVIRSFDGLRCPSTTKCHSARRNSQYVFVSPTRLLQTQRIIFAVSVFHAALVVFAGIQIHETKAALVRRSDCDGSVDYVVSRI